jgi:hypothetical protein
MSAKDDFGYGNVEWEKANAKNVELVEAEYRQRFEGSLAGAADIDKKAQFVFTALVGLVTAILTLAFAQARNVETHYLVGLFTLASFFGVGAVFASVSVYPRSYSHLGTTPANLNVSEWTPLLMGDEKAAIRLSGVRIKEYARAIYDHTRANQRKSFWLKLTLWATVLSFPVALALVFLVAIFLHAPKAAVVAPIAATIALCLA